MPDNKLSSKSTPSLHPNITTSPIIASKTSWSWATVLIITLLTAIATILVGNFVIQNYLLLQT